MKQQNLCPGRLLRAVLPLVFTALLLLFSSRMAPEPIGADHDAVYVRATVTQVLEDQSGGEAYRGGQKLLAQVTGGYFKGQSCTLVNANTYQRGALCVPGTKVIALLNHVEGHLQGTVYNYDRTGMVVGLVVLFALTLLLVGGKKGGEALYALAFTVICIFCVYIPTLCAGVNAMAAAVLTAVVTLVVAIYIMHGWSEKSLCAIVGTTIGVAVSGLLAMAVGNWSSLSGYSMEDVESMVYIANNTRLQIHELLYGGILISSLGAVMDVSVSVTAAVWEVHEKAPSLAARELFRSGMRVGRDMMGTMSNTLILAYTGSATGVLLTVYSYNMPFLQVMGYNSIIIEILSGLCGTIGVVLTVPVQAGITAAVLRKQSIKR